MMKLDPKVQRIIQWRESLTTLPETHFFELIRMYLGEIKTPYNKEKLIEELGAFIRKAENKKTLVMFLDAADREIISAVRFIPEATQEKLSVFFGKQFSYAALYEHLLNLEERLIIYRHEDAHGRKTLISINPLLEDVLFEITSLNLLLPKTFYSEKNESIPFTINPQFIAAFISYAFAHPEMYKADHSFKKRSHTELKELFENTGTETAVETRLELLSNAFWTMNVFIENDEGNLEISSEKLEALCALSPSMQYLYICAASAGHFGRSTLSIYTQILLDTIAVIPHEGYTRDSLLKLIFFVKAENGYSTLQTQAGFFASQTDSPSDLNELLLDACISMGILYDSGKDINGEKVYSVSPLYNTDYSMPGEPKVLSIDAGFSITIMPGLSLGQLIPLIRFMDCVRYDTAAVFEINKTSVMRSFDSGYDSQKIFDLLQKYNSYELSQNLKISVEEWYASFNSAALYKGYVLKLSKDKCALIEKNPLFAPYLRLKLHEGLYLLDFNSDEEAKNILHKSGLEFIGSIKSTDKKTAVLPFQVLTASVSKNLLEAVQSEGTDFTEEEKDTAGEKEKQQKNHMDFLYAELQKLNASPEQQEALADRIARKIILTPEQLRPSSVRLEILEASGMDYSGKLHVIESAISSNSMVELRNTDSKQTIVGTPLALLNKKLNASIRIQTEPDQEIAEYPVSTIQFIKKLRGSVLR